MKLRITNTKISKDNITELKENEIFVFGSNKYGYHDGGAAKFAFTKFGAIYGNGHGLQGQSYAIDSMSGIETIQSEVYRFIKFARKNNTLNFLVTEIGCGIAGYEPKDIAILFKEYEKLENIYLPERFVNILQQS